MNLNKLLLLALFSFFFLFSGVRADIVGNLITNGDFETPFTSSNISYLSASWSNTRFTGADCDTGIDYCIVLNSTACALLNMTGQCFEDYINAGGSQRSISSTPFLWTSNSSSTTVTFYHFGNTGIAIRLISVDGLTSYGVKSGSICSSVTCKESLTLSGFTQNTQFRLEFDMNGGTDERQRIDNVTLFDGNNTLVPVTLFGSCEIDYPNTTIGFLNVTQKCETSPIDTTNCINITNVGGNFVNNYYGGWADCNGKAETFTYAFNTSFTSISRPPSCVSGIATLYDNSYSDNNTVPYFNNTNAFSTCYYPYANSNLTLARMFCFLSMSCFLNRTSLGQGCNSICTGGYLKENGTYDASLNTCTGFTKVSHCAVGCGSLTSCGLTNVYNGSDFRQSIFGNINGTGSNNPSLFNIMGSTLFIILLLIIVIIGLLYEVLPNQHLTIMVYSILVAIFTIIGYIPTWLGLSLCIMGIGLTVLLSKR